MSARNLTSHSPSHSDGAPDDLTNNGVTDKLDKQSNVKMNQTEVSDPFLDTSDLDPAGEVFENSSSSMLRTSVHSPNVSEYRGYYSRNNPHSNNNTKRVNSIQQVLGLPSTTSLLSKNTGSNEPLSSSEHDNYQLSGSRIVSSTSPLNQNNINNNQSGYTQQSHGMSSSHNNSSTSISSSNPFLSDQDFSPFGGYPASSFFLHMDEKEEDDYLHNPDPEEEARLDKDRFIIDFKNMDRRSAGGFVGFLFLFIGALALFVIFPTLTYTGAVDRGPKYDIVELLSLYVYPQLSAIRTSLVDPDTPSDAMTKIAKDGTEWKLVFSDEFNALGRTFYEGDDQFWTAMDFHYAATRDLEWYTPDAVTTMNGTLQLRMDAFPNHNLFYRSGMMQSWNKLCFTQGHLEISANLANYGRVTGLWPGLWTMGNLGRPGYMASTEGVWPFSYESCDAGITPNQSSPDGISYLPGQKLSICTCDGEDHPNQGVGRGAPEIDIIEGEVSTVLGVGLASQSMQIAPFDIWYIPDYSHVEIYNFTTTTMNTYCGGPFQQAVSAVSTLNVTWYEFGEDAGYFQTYAIEYIHNDDTGYIRWFVGNTPTFTVYSQALHPNGNIGWRRISKEPMSIIMNLGISNNWAYIDWQFLFFPVTMSIDYVRLYQPSANVSVTCDPEDHPTFDYIQAHKKAYYDNNATTWEEAGYTFPKNILTGQCKSSKFSLTDQK